MKTIRNTKNNLHNQKLNNISSSEEPTNSQEPTSSEEPTLLNHFCTNKKIVWSQNTEWYSITKNIGYPRLQNLPMLNALTPEKQSSLVRAYQSVYGNSIDNISKEWKSYDCQ